MFDCRGEPSLLSKTQTFPLHNAQGLLHYFWIFKTGFLNVWKSTCLSHSFLISTDVPVEAPRKPNHPTA